jgi:hypothetical protein
MKHSAHFFVSLLLPILLVASAQAAISGFAGNQDARTGDTQTGIPASDPNKAQLQQMQNDGATYTAEQNTLIQA